eukprot:Awhi_evm1s12768
MDPSLDILRMQHYEYPEALIISKIAKILLVEKLGMRVKLAPTEFSYDLNYLKELNDYQFDVNVGVYQDISLNKYRNIEILGFVGYYELSGWYIPKYLLETDLALASYLGIPNAYGNTNLFCPNATDFFNYQNFKSRTNRLVNNECSTSLDLSKEEALNCLNVIKTYDHSLSNCSLNFFSSPNNIDWSHNANIVRNLNFSAFLNVSYANEDSDVVVEDQLFEFTEENYNAKLPFMVHLYEPSDAVSKKANFSLHRMSLPSFNSACSAIY